LNNSYICKIHKCININELVGRIKQAIWQFHYPLRLMPYTKNIKTIKINYNIFWNKKSCKTLQIESLKPLTIWKWESISLIWRFSFDVEFGYVDLYWLTMWQIDKAHPFIEERNERH
jgi:hypothetical protein